MLWESIGETLHTSYSIECVYTIQAQAQAQMHNRNHTTRAMLHAHRKNCCLCAPIDRKHIRHQWARVRVWLCVCSHIVPYFFLVYKTIETKQSPTVTRHRTKWTHNSKFKKKQLTREFTEFLFFPTEEPKKSNLFSKWNSSSWYVRGF